MKELVTKGRIGLCLVKNNKIKDDGDYLPFLGNFHSCLLLVVQINSENGV